MVENYSSQKVHDLLEQGVDLILLDVREDAEYIASHIPGAVWIPKSRLNQNKPDAWKKLKSFNKESLIVVYCASGIRSVSIVTQLCKEGFNAVNMDGFLYWKRKFPVES